MRTVLLVTLFFAGCGEEREIREWTPDDHLHPEQADPSRMAQQVPVGEDAAGSSEERAAAALWLVSCASCHGREGRGDGPARPPNAQMADLTDPEWQASKSDEEIAQVIAEGKGLMQPFGDRINPRGIAALTAHIRRMSPEAAQGEEAPEEAPEEEAPEQEPEGEPAPRRAPQLPPGHP